MPELLPYLLVPVAALLFLNLHLSRKLRYPHDLLRAETRRGPASFLLRSFRTYYDVLLDGALAVALAFAMGPSRGPRPAAVVIDGSRAMTAGFADDRPLVKALKRLRTDPALRGAEPFLLALDPQTAATRLVPLRRDLEGVDSEGAARRLMETCDFFAPDYGRLADLRRQGYGEVTLLTDQLRVEPVGFRAVELGMAVNFAVFPSGVRYDPGSKSWMVVLAEQGYRVPIGISGWDREGSRFVRVPRDRFSIEEGVAGRVVRFAVPGLYLLSFKGPYGLDDIDLPVLLAPPQARAEARGPFSEKMLSVFPGAEAGTSPALALVDRGTTAPGKGRRIVTALLAADGRQVQDPATTGGALLAVGREAGTDLALGPSSLGNEDLVLVYESILAAQDPPFLTEPPAGARHLFPAGTAYLSDQGRPLVPPPSQFFETRPVARLVLPRPVPERWPWAALLACLAAVKLLAWAKFTGKSLLARD